MSYKVDNAVIMAAGFSNRFAPLSFEKPKSLVNVKGEILIERQIRQLREAGIRDVIVVVGYKKEAFQYLEEKMGVVLVENTEYATRNNNSSIKAVERYLGNTYICSSDNYFSENPFEREVEAPYYAAEYSAGETAEWCLKTDDEGWITDVTIGGCGQWYMMGHVFWDKKFSERFLKILNSSYNAPETAGMLWESIYARHIGQLKLKMRKYPPNYIFEFDSLDELRRFDDRYKEHSGSRFMEQIAAQFHCTEGEIRHCRPWQQQNGEIQGFSFELSDDIYGCRYANGQIEKLGSVGM